MKKIIILAFLNIFAVKIYADSPITSTDFYKAYSDIEMVNIAEQNGKLTPEIMDFLYGKAPIDQKMAVINAIGWDFNGKYDYSLFKNYLNEKGMGKKKAKAENLLCLAYLKAMDNYFDCKEALAIAKQALKLNPKSYTFNIIHGLIAAQVDFDSDWTKVYLDTHTVRENTSLKADMRAHAITIIFEYMDLYRPGANN